MLFHLGWHLGRDLKEGVQVSCGAGDVPQSRAKKMCLRPGWGWRPLGEAVGDQKCQQDAYRTAEKEEESQGQRVIKRWVSYCVLSCSFREVSLPTPKGLRNN